MKLSKALAPAFWSLHRDIQQHGHTFYWLKGGRGSGKSSFISLEILLVLLRHKDRHAVILRKVGRSLKTSVYAQIQWAIERLGLMDTGLFICKKSPLEIIYRPTGQILYFFGVDDPMKIKSIKPPNGYIGIVWLEEADQFLGMDEIRNLNQSLLRGGKEYIEFVSFNPPKSRDHWINAELFVDDAARLVHASTYRDMPVAWLGEQFFLEAEKLKAHNERAYRHEYLGEATGTGGAVFENVADRRMTDAETAAFGRVYHGLDFGFAVDPLAFLSCAYDRKREDVYIFEEIYEQRLSNSRATARIRPLAGQNVIYADSAEPKSIAEMKGLGLRIFGARKGRDSVAHGIKWLQDRAHIYIDKVRCPHTYREFVTYAYERNREGQFISAYPDRNNHTIDAARYALGEVMRAGGIRVLH
nr:MAG TPA: terminase large subunit [Caudoviricetes sp.]